MLPRYFGLFFFSVFSSLVYLGACNNSCFTEVTDGHVVCALEVQRIIKTKKTWAFVGGEKIFPSSAYLCLTAEKCTETVDLETLCDEAEARVQEKLGLEHGDLIGTGRRYTYIPMMMCCPSITSWGAIPADSEIEVAWSEGQKDLVDQKIGKLCAEGEDPQKIYEEVSSDLGDPPE